MGIVPPCHEHRARRAGPRRLGHGEGRRLGAVALARHMGVGQAQEGDARRVHAEHGDGTAGLVLAQRPQFLRRVEGGMGVRAAAVAHHHETHIATLGAGGGDETAATEALVIGMGRHHHEAARPDQRVEGSQRQGVGGGEKGVGTHRAGSPVPAARPERTAGTIGQTG